MNAIDIIKRPIVTEKTAWESASRNRVSFEVDPRATKAQIRHAVASLYNVRVIGVATQVRKGVYKRSRYGEVKLPDWKRATVQLHPDSKIELI